MYKLFRIYILLIYEIDVDFNKIFNYEHIFSEKLSFPRTETATNNRKNALFNKNLICFQKILDDLHHLSEPDDKLPHEINDIFFQVP